MNSHPVGREELMAYLDGELSTDRASVAAEHLGTCVECQEVASDLRSVSEQMVEWRVDVPVLVAPREAMRVTEPAKKRRPWYLWKPVWGVAVVCILAVGSLFSPQMYVEHRSIHSPRLMFAPNRAETSAFPVAKAKLPKSVGDSPILIAHSSHLSLVASDFDHARGAIDEILKRHHAYIAEMTVNTEASSSRTLDASIRTPDAQLDATISELRALGRVLQESRTGEEVTQQSIDLDARLANARNSEERLTELLWRRTDKLSDVLEVENQISTTRGEIEQMEAERKNLNNRIEYARLDVRVTEVYQARLEGDQVSTVARLRNSAIEGWKAVGDSMVGIAVVTLSEGPVILVWCLIMFFPARYAWRRFKK